MLVRQAAALARPGDVVVDLCCGSGAVGVALADAVPALDLYATDIDPIAVRCARRNVVPAGGHVFEGDLFDALPEAVRGRVDLLVANAPYVPTDSIATMPPEARLHEPGQAPTWLTPGGHLLIETSSRQVPGTVELFTRGGFTARVARSPELDATVVVGSWRP